MPHPIWFEAGSENTASTSLSDRTANFRCISLSSKRCRGKRHFTNNCAMSSQLTFSGVVGLALSKKKTYGSVNEWSLATKISNGKSYPLNVGVKYELMFKRSLNIKMEPKLREARLFLRTFDNS